MIMDMDLRDMSQATVEAYIRRVKIFIKDVDKKIENISL